MPASNVRRVRSEAFSKKSTSWRASSAWRKSSGCDLTAWPSSMSAAISPTERSAIEQRSRPRRRCADFGESGVGLQPERGFWGGEGDGVASHWLGLLRVRRGWSGWSESDQSAAIAMSTCRRSRMYGGRKRRTVSEVRLRMMCWASMSARTCLASVSESSSTPIISPVPRTSRMQSWRVASDSSCCLK